MIQHVVIGQRLFEHRQVEFIQLLKQWEVAQRVGRIRIAHQLNVWKACAHLPDNIKIPSRLNLDLDPLITGIQFSRYLLQQCFG